MGTKKDEKSVEESPAPARAPSVRVPDGPSVVVGGPVDPIPSRNPDKSSAEHWALGAVPSSAKRAAFVRWAAKRAPPLRLASEWHALYQTFLSAKV